MLEPIGKHPERQGFGSVDCSLARLAISEHARKFRHLRDPTTVRLLLDFNRQWHNYVSLKNPGAIQFDGESSTN